MRLKFKLIIFISVFLIIILPRITLATNTYSLINYTLEPILNIKNPYLKVNIDINGLMFNEITLQLPYRWDKC